jgi:L-ribulokinase
MVTKRDSAPLCNIDEFKYEPHSWVKLWKHHASQSEADTINELADDLEAEFRHRYCRKSAEWFFPKVLVACPHKGYHFLC